MLQGSRNEHFNGEARRHLKRSGLTVESSKGEAGVGQQELNIKVKQPLFAILSPLSFPFSLSFPLSPSPSFLLLSFSLLSLLSLFPSLFFFPFSVAPFLFLFLSLSLCLCLCLSVSVCLSLSVSLSLSFSLCIYKPKGLLSEFSLIRIGLHARTEFFPHF